MKKNKWLFMVFSRDPQGASSDLKGPQGMPNGAPQGPPKDPQGIPKGHRGAPRDPQGHPISLDRGRLNLTWGLLGHALYATRVGFHAM